MQLAKFGHTGLTVSRLCLGTATFGKQTDEAESHRLLDAGINFLDTANFYPMGAGPFVGGLIVHQLGWRSIFYLNLPIGVLGVILTAILLRPSQLNHRPFDVASHLLIMGALSGISFTLIEGHTLNWFASRAIVLSVLVASASITLFAIRECVAPHPVIPHALMHNRRFWILNAAGTLMFAVLFGEIFVVTLFLEKARGASAFMAGIQMLPIMGVFAFVNYYAGRASAVWSNRRTMTIGYGTAAMGAASTILVGGAAPYWLLAITLVICNPGLGFSGPAKVRTTDVVVKPEDVQRLSPLLLDHVNVLGRYEFRPERIDPAGPTATASRAQGSG